MEEGGRASFVVELSGAAAETVIVGYATSNETGAGHATAGTDYTATNGALTLTFKPDESLSQTIAVTTIDDPFNEPTEKFTVTLTEPDPPGFPDLVSIGTSSVQGTITDNDGLTAAVTAVDIDTSVDEGETAEFTVTLTGGTSTAEVLVTYTVGGTATAGEDYTAPTDLTLTIGTGVASGTISIETLTDTVVAEGNETLEVTLSEASTATGSAAVDADNATATTAINDTTKATVTLRPPVTSSSSVASRSSLVQQEEQSVDIPPRAMIFVLCEDCFHEGVSYKVPPTLEDETGNFVSMPAGEMFTVDYGSTSGTATVGVDYAALSGTLTIRGTGEGSAVEADEITLTILDDNLNEGIETFLVTLTGQNLPAGVTLGEEATVKIAASDPITANVSASSQSVLEGAPVSFTVTLTEAESTDEVTIQYSVSGTATSGDDYRAPSGTLTIAKGSTRGTFTIQTRDDTVVESDETLVLQLDRGRSAGTVRASDAVSVTILDNDLLTVSVEPATASEGDPASFVVRLSKAVPDDVDRLLEVSYATTADTGVGAAVKGSDYTPVSGTLTFTSGQTSKTVQVTTLEDHLNEADETFTLTLTANLPDWAEFGTDSATGTIEDEDELTVAVTEDADIVSEGDPATFTVALAGGTSTGDVVVTYSVGGSATASDDYTTPDGTLTIGMGETSGIITIATRADEVVESDETLEVTLDMGKSVGKVKVDPTPATTMIIDPPAVTIGDASAAESAAAIMFEVKLSAGSPRQVTVSYDTEDGTAKAGEDYTEANGTLTFAAMVELATISISLRDDRLDEEDETFTVAPPAIRCTAGWGTPASRQRVRSSMTTIRPQSRSMTPARRRALERSRSG